MFEGSVDGAIVEGALDEAVVDVSDVGTIVEGTDRSFMFLIFDKADELEEALMADLKLLLDDCFIIGLFLSTTGSLDSMIPKIKSAKRPPRDIVQPATWLATFDLYKGENKHLLLGRPLWYHYYLKKFSGKEKTLYYSW